jgi:hypothetical protein
MNAAGYRTCGVLFLLMSLGGLVGFQQIVIQDLRSEARKSAEKLAAINEVYAQPETPAISSDVLHNEELERLRLENRDLLRLRNEVHQLRDQVQEKDRAADKLRDELLARNTGPDIRSGGLDADGNIWHLSTGTSSFAPASLSFPSIPRNSYIGVVFSGSFTNSQPQGVAIQSVTQQSPAAEAQLQIGDVILRIDGHTMGSVEQIVRTVAGHNPGDTLIFDFLRDGVWKQAAVVTKAPPEQWSRK